MPGPLAPATSIAFPDLEYQGVVCAPPCQNTGVVNIDIEAGHISIAPPPAGAASSFALVFGNRIRNVNYRFPFGPGTNCINEWPYIFAHAISATHAPNVVVANNLIAKATATRSVRVNFIGTRGAANFSGELPFLYDNRYGIDVKTAPGWKSVNISIDSNYVYQNGRVGIMWNSSDVDPEVRGSGVRVLNNHVEVAANTTCYSIDGQYLTSGSDTNENRGYNQQGHGSFVQGNTGHVNRQRAAFTPYDTVDGEGILQQPMDSVTGYRNVWDANDLRGGGSGYIAYFGLDAVVNNTITNCLANADQQIGLMAPVPGLVVGGNECRGNSPACTGMA